MLALTSRVKAIFTMTRPLNSFMTGLAVVFAYLVNTNYKFNYELLAIGFITGYLASASSMLVNDYVDLEADKINKPWKPLPRGIVSPKIVFILSLVFLITAVMINLFVSEIAFFTVLLLATIAYSYSFLRKYWWSHFIVSTGTTAPIVYGYVLAGLPRDTLVLNTLFATVVFLINSSREFIKSVADIEGDRKSGYYTIAVKYGKKTAISTALLIAVAGVIIALLIGFLGFANRVYTITLFASGLWFILNIVKIYREPCKEKVLKTKNSLLKAMLLALIGYLLSRL